MKLPNALSLFLLCCLAVLAGNAVATENGRNIGYGARGGFSFDSEENFTHYTVFAAIPMPWMHTFASGWQFESVLDLSLGVLDGGGETGVRGIIGADAIFFSPARSVSLTTGIGAGVMSEDVYGEVDFSGPVFFTFEAGANYWFSDSFSMGYRFHHESNGSIYDKNPSLNMHQLELRFHF